MVRVFLYSPSACPAAPRGSAAWERGSIRKAVPPNRCVRMCVCRARGTRNPNTQHSSPPPLPIYLRPSRLSPVASPLFHSPLPPPNYFKVSPEVPLVARFSCTQPSVTKASPRTEKQPRPKNVTEAQTFAARAAHRFFVFRHGRFVPASSPRRAGCCVLAKVKSANSHKDNNCPSRSSFGPCIRLRSSFPP